MAGKVDAVACREDAMDYREKAVACQENAMDWNEESMDSEEKSTVYKTPIVVIIEKK